jgi:hypothetical protein
MSDSLVTTVIVVTLVINYLLLSDKKKGFASMNIVGWGIAPDDEDAKDDKNSDDKDSKDDKGKDGKDDSNKSSSKISRRKSMLEENIIPAENTHEDQNTNLYGRAQDEYDGYINAYTDCWREPKPAVVQSCSEQDYSIDSANALMAQRRARDKRCMDGLVSKDAAFYRHHFAEELDEEENKPWWSRSEY